MALGSSPWMSYNNDSVKGKTSQSIANNVGGSYTGQDIETMGGPGVQTLMQGAESRRNQDNQYENQSKLMDQGASNDLISGEQQGAFQILNTLLSKGYIDESQKAAALAYLQNVMGDINGAGGLAAQFAQDGGIDPETMNALVGEYMNARTKANTLAERGGLTTDEYQRILNSGRNDLMRQGRNAAESTFNQMNQGSPFAAGALMAQNAANTGAEMVKQRADLDKYQSDTRIKGNEQLAALLNQAVDALMQRSGMKSKGLDALNALIGQKADVAGSMSELETKTKPSGDGSLGIVDELLNSLGDFVNTKKKKDGSATADTVLNDKDKDNRKRSGGGTAFAF